jgi:hypothetical protein
MNTTSFLWSSAMPCGSDDAEGAVGGGGGADGRDVTVGAGREDHEPVARVVVGRPDLAGLGIDVDARLEFDLGLVAGNRPLGNAELGARRRVLEPVVDEDLERALVGEHDLVALGVHRHGGKGRIRVPDPAHVVLVRTVREVRRQR